MRTIEQASAFKRDFKRESKSQHRATLGSELQLVLIALTTDQPLDAKYRDHDLSGKWAGYRECHIRRLIAYLPKIKCRYSQAGSAWDA